MLKLKSLLKEGFAWERKDGKPLPTLAEVQAEYERNMNELDSPYGEGNGLGTTEDEDEFLDYTNNELVNFLKNSDDKMKKEYAAYELTKRMDKLKDLTRTDNI